MDVLREFLLEIIDLDGWLELNFWEFILSLSWLIVQIIGTIWIAKCVLRGTVKALRWIVTPAFCLLFRRAEGREMKRHRAWLAERYCSGDVIWQEKLWQVCSWRNVLLLAWARGFATRQVVMRTRETIDSMKAEVNEKKKVHWLKYRKTIPYVYSATEMERRTKVKNLMDQYKNRLWRVSCVALYEYNEIFVFRIRYPREATALPRRTDRPVFRCEYDEAVLLEEFIPWLQNLERSHDDLDKTVGKQLWHDMSYEEVYQCCEEHFFATYYRFGDEVPIPPEYHDEEVVDRVAKHLSDAWWWQRLKWWCFKRFALGISRLEDKSVEPRNVGWHFKVIDLSADKAWATKKKREDVVGLSVFASSKNN